MEASDELGGMNFEAMSDTAATAPPASPRRTTSPSARSNASGGGRSSRAADTSAFAYNLASQSRAVGFCFMAVGPQTWLE
jgi:hypothetical protein